MFKWHLRPRALGERAVERLSTLDRAGEQVNKPVLYMSIAVTLTLLSVFNYKIKPSPSEKQLSEYAEGMSGNTEWRGQVAPDFELRTTSGERFRLSENVGKKIIVLNFFATWCAPCRAEMP